MCELALQKADYWDPIVMSHFSRAFDHSLQQNSLPELLQDVDPKTVIHKSILHEWVLSLSSHSFVYSSICYWIDG